MYDAVVGRWWVIDPFGEKRLWLSPYQYAQDNPIILLDPDGRLDDNYIFDEKGNFIRKEENKRRDKIIIQNSVTGDIDAEIKVGPDGTLEDKFYQTDKETGFSNITDRDLAKKIFEFFADNTYVEWAWGETQTLTNEVFTAHIVNHVPIGEYRLETYKRFTHNHPSGNPKPSFEYSDGKLSDGDQYMAQYSKEKGYNIEFYIYVKGNNREFPKGYDKFDENGALHKYLPSYGGKPIPSEEF